MQKAITEEQQERIYRNYLKTGRTLQELSEIYGINKMTISNTITKKLNNRKNGKEAFKEQS